MRIRRGIALLVCPAVVGVLAALGPAPSAIGAATPAAGTTALPSGSTFTPMAPLRVLDTRDGSGTGG